MYTVSPKKNNTFEFLIITSANVDRFSKLFPCKLPDEILVNYITKILQLTLITFLHYFVKHENYNCCRFQ